MALNKSLLNKDEVIVLLFNINADTLTRSVEMMRKI